MDAIAAVVQFCASSATNRAHSHTAFRYYILYYVPP